MSNYEVMLILDPKSDEKTVSEIAKSTFKSKDLKIEKLERTELAYEINKSKTATYILLNVKATGEEINEFTRKANISKNIWRILSINLDTEKGLNRKAKPKRIKKSSNTSKKSLDVKKSKEQTTSTNDDKNEDNTKKTAKSSSTKTKKSTKKE